MRASSLDLRERIITALETGQSVQAVAERSAVSARTVRRYRQQWRTASSLTARTSPGRPRLISSDQHAALTELVLTRPDATLRHYCQQWQAASGVSVSEAIMCRTLQQLALTRKASVG